MSDERLRELERKWRETGADADFERYLLELIRTGTIPAGTQGTNKPFAELSSGEKTYLRMLTENPAPIIGMDDKLRSTLYESTRQVSIGRIITPHPRIHHDQMESIIAQTYSEWIISDTLELRAQVEDTILRSFVRAAAYALTMKNSTMTEQRSADEYCRAVNITRTILKTDACDRDIRSQLICAFQIIGVDNPLLASMIAHYALPRPQKTYQMPDFLKV